ISLRNLHGRSPDPLVQANTDRRRRKYHVAPSSAVQNWTLEADASIAGVRFVVPVLRLIDGHRAAVANGVPDVLLSPPDLFRPPKYLEPCPSPRDASEVPRRTIFLCG